MTKETIYKLVKGKSYYNGISALSIQGLRVCGADDTNDVKSIIVKNDKQIWRIYYCTGLHGKHAWTVDNPLEV